MAPEPGEEGGRFSGKGPSLRQMATPAGRPLAQTDVLSTSEVAELLGIPRSSVHELARRGDLPARGRTPLALPARPGRRGNHAAGRSGRLEASKSRLKSLERYSTALLRKRQGEPPNGSETKKSPP
jgi:Helix-turn-helix domain